jgi:protease-4
MADQSLGLFKSYVLWLMKLMTLFVLAFVALPLVIIAIVAATGSDSKPHVALGKSDKTVAVIELNGVIMDSKELVEQLYKQADNKHVAGIVLKINSPGGAVAPSQAIYEAVKKLKAKKPIIASMETVAASGGLYSALSADKIFCQRGTQTGSIGVVLQFPVVRNFTDWLGVNMVTVKSGKFKDVGNPFRDLTPEDQAFLDSTIQVIYQDFVTAVSEGRNIPREKVETFADGRLIIGSQAVELKLVDAFGDVHDAARAVFEKLGKPLPEGEEAELYYPEDRFASFKKIFEMTSYLPQMLSTPGPQALLMAY